MYLGSHSQVIRRTVESTQVAREQSAGKKRSVLGMTARVAQSDIDARCQEVHVQDNGGMKATEPNDLSRDSDEPSEVGTKQREIEILHLYWILAHEASNGREPPRDPPPPPWL